MPKTYGEKKLSKRLLKHYTKPFAKRSQRSGAIAFARSLLKDQAWFEELWKKRKAIANKPTLFIWRIKDAIIKPHYLDKFMSGFQNSSALKLANCGHFPQEEESEKMVRTMRKFLM